MKRDIVTISSRQNPRVKSLLRLYTKSRERIRSGLFVVEGEREIRMALQAGYKIRTLYLREDAGREEWQEMIPPGFGGEIYGLSASLFEQIGYRTKTGGMVAVVERRETGLSSLSLPENALVVVLESPEKPGNTGAVLRTADAFGADALLIAAPHTDVFHPNTIRSSLGAVFSVPVATGTNEEIRSFLFDRGFRLFKTLISHTSVPFGEPDYSGAVALLFGAEATGLTGFWRDTPGTDIIIPMRGMVDSFNLSVSVALVLYEAVRKRKML